MSEIITSKLGKTRAGERTRVWLEGKRLLAAGFTHGTRFERHWSLGRLMILACTEDHFEALPVKCRGTVSGSVDRPVIDITGEIVSRMLGMNERVAVRFARHQITVESLKP